MSHLFSLHQQLEAFGQDTLEDWVKHHHTCPNTEFCPCTGVAAEMKCKFQSNCMAIWQTHILDHPCHHPLFWERMQECYKYLGRNYLEYKQPLRLVYYNLAHFL